STDTYRTRGWTVSTISENRPAAAINFALRDSAGVRIHGSAPGWYWYQMGTVSGARSGPAFTDKAATCGSARNSSRSCRVRAMAAPYGAAPTVRLPRVRRGQLERRSRSLAHRLGQLGRLLDDGVAAQPEDQPHHPRLVAVTHRHPQPPAVEFLE